MGWRENLQDASIGGVPFQIESTDDSSGRRLETHEYPDRDIPYTEDNGRKARLSNVVGFVIGDDYMVKRDALITMLESGGSKEFVHPYFGRMMVDVGDFSSKHSFDEGGVCRFQISLVESGQKKYPSGDVSTQSQTAIAADSAAAAASKDFSDVFDVSSQPEFVSDAARSDLGVVLDVLDSSLSAAVLISDNPLGSLRDDMDQLIYNPVKLASRVFGLFNKATSVVGGIEGLADSNFVGLLRIKSVINLISRFTHSDAVGGTASSRAVIRNRNAINALTRSALITQSAGMISQVDLPIYDDALEAKQELLANIDVSLLTANDVVYVNLENLRAKVNADANARIKNSARIKELELTEVKPALVLAYDLYEDVGREAEIVSRNKLHHPGFVPVDKIKVLSV